MLWVVAFALLVILLADQISSTFIKPYFARLRPCNDAALASQMRILVRCGVGYSFVSSHAANHFGLSFFLLPLFKGNMAKSLLVLWAVAVSLSQIYVGVHYPSDVFFGAVLGMAIGTFAAWAFRKVLKQL